jgi:hypothetical protein
VTAIRRPHNAAGAWAGGACRGVRATKAVGTRPGGVSSLSAPPAVGDERRLNPPLPRFGLPHCLPAGPRHATETLLAFPAACMSPGGVGPRLLDPAEPGPCLEGKAAVGAPARCSACSILYQTRQQAARASGPRAQGGIRRRIGPLFDLGNQDIAQHVIRASIGFTR